MNRTPRTLRARLLASYAALALAVTVQATVAAATLIGRQLDRGARADLAGAAARLAEELEAEASAAPWRPLSVLLGDRRHGHPPGEVLLVDGDGLLLAVAPPGGRGDRLPPLEGARFPPPRPAGTVGVVALPGPGAGRGERVVYASAPVPTLGGYLDPPREAHVVLLRPAREVRGQWRTLVRPIGLVGLGTLALAGALALVLARSITTPILAVTRASERLAAGDFAARVPIAGDAEAVRLAHAFNAMAERIGDTYARQRDFLTNVTHDLRTPLTAVRGFAEALKDGTASTPERRAAAVDAILAAAGRMNDLVESLLELARIEGRAASLAPAPVPVRALLEEAADACAPRVAARGARIALAVDGEPVAWVDRRWMVRALVNVIDNALVHGPEGGQVTLSARTADGDDGPPATRVTVSDEGPGIPEDQLPYVFERFYRGDPARAAGGSGLGLSIAREIVEAHGGRIRIGRAAGRGARVTIDLPAAERPSVTPG